MGVRAAGSFDGQAVVSTLLDEVSTMVRTPCLPWALHLPACMPIIAAPALSERLRCSWHQTKIVADIVT